MIDQSRLDAYLSRTIDYAFLPDIDDGETGMGGLVSARRML